MQSDNRATGAVLVTAPSQAAVEHARRLNRLQRFWTWGYVALLGCCSILSAAAAASQITAGDALVGGLLILLCGQLGVICVHLATGMLGLRGNLHTAGSPECFTQVRQYYTDNYQHLALVFAPQGPLAAEGVRPEDAAEYMLLMNESADVEQHLAALQERMAALREAESDTREAALHAAGCACAGCGELD
jgi:hypothetical protein